jgi:hypothetical protein
MTQPKLALFKAEWYLQSWRVSFSARFIICRSRQHGRKKGWVQNYLRFGLEDGRSRTLEEVGLEFNVTRERIRQIEAKALRKLRHPRRSGKLRGYLE